jgi:hypothetical protein
MSNIFANLSKKYGLDQMLAFEIQGNNNRPYFVQLFVEKNSLIVKLFLGKKKILDCFQLNIKNND